MRPKAILTIVALGMSYAPAHARSLHIGGTAGYLSEWEINATVAEDESDGGSLHGPLTLKHTGLCAVKGPVEKSGELRLRMSGWGPFSRIEAVMSFGDARCVYRGSSSGGTSGAMDCPDAKGVPVTLSIK